MEQQSEYTELTNHDSIHEINTQIARTQEIIEAVTSESSSSSPPLTVNPPSTSNLFDACVMGKLEQIERYLKAGADPNGVVKNGYCTPLYFACVTNRFDIAKLLVHFNARPTTDDLTTVCRTGDCDLVKAFLEADADPNKNCVNVCCTPLYVACMINNPTLVELLLVNGACDTLSNIIDENGCEIKMYPEYDKNYSRPYEKNGEYDWGEFYSEIENLSVENSARRRKKWIHLLEEKCHHEYAIHAAVRVGSIEIVAKFIKYGRFYRINDVLPERTPYILDIAIAAGNNKLAWILLNNGEPMEHPINLESFLRPIPTMGPVEITMIRPARVKNTKNQEEEEEEEEEEEKDESHTYDALYHAVANGHYITTLLLLDKGASVHHSYGKHGSALDIARRRHDIVTEELLISYGALGSTVPTPFLCRSNRNNNSYEDDDNQQQQPQPVEPPYVNALGIIEPTYSLKHIPVGRIPNWIVRINTLFYWLFITVMQMTDVTDTTISFFIICLYFFKKIYTAHSTRYIMCTSQTSKGRIYTSIIMMKSRYYR
jgi:ankyrin repeat protein